LHGQSLHLRPWKHQTSRDVFKPAHALHPQQLDFWRRMGHRVPSQWAQPH
jgi:hypothetical protein